MQTPSEARPKITELDIRRGYIKRYFVQLISTKKIYEVDKTQYDFFSANPYYSVMVLSWIIAGDINTTVVDNYTKLGIIDQNNNIIEYYNKKMSGLNRKLRNPLEYVQRWTA